MAFSERSVSPTHAVNSNYIPFLFDIELIARAQKYITTVVVAHPQPSLTTEGWMSNPSFQGSW
jgi:hypothetical protein